MKMERSANDGRQRIPSVPLAGGGPIVSEEMTPFTWRSTDRFAVGRFDHSANSDSSILWNTHNSNMGKPKDQWSAFYKCWITNHSKNEIRCDGVEPSFIDPITGGLVQHRAIAGKSTRNAFHWTTSNIGQGGGDSMPCPAAEGGGDFHFYSHWANNREEFAPNRQSGCTWYAPNYALSVSGYGYSETVDVSASDAGPFTSRPDIARCPLSPKVLQLIADRVYAIAGAESATDGVVYEPILLEDVRVAGPTLGAALARAPLADFQALGGVVPSSSAPPIPQPVPAGFVPPNRPPSSGGDPGGSGERLPPLDLTAPDVDDPVPSMVAPDMAMPDWFPNLHFFTLPEPSGNCPQFGFDALGESFVVESHCQFIETNRALIASIMVIVYAFGAYAIILRA